MPEKTTKPYRLPAEWEPQDAILLAWPHGKTDWADMLAEVEQVYLQLVHQIIRFEPVIIVCSAAKDIRAKLEANDIDTKQVYFLEAESNDTWARDFGPLSVFSGPTPVFLDFTFNGWGQKFAADKDDKINRHLCRSGLIKARHQTVDLVLEGGSIETDGQGTLLTTSKCLLNPNRNPHLTQKQLEQQFSHYFGIDHFLWLDYGGLAGDDTDAHIDTLARLCPETTILYVSCDPKEDVHFSDLELMKKQLLSFKTKQRQAYRLLPLPWPKARYDRQERLPATYANYLVINGAVLVPTYQDPADKIALETIAQAFQDRQVIGIDCLPLIKQHGSLHCITMQLAKGSLA